MRQFELHAKKLTGIGRHALVLEQVAAATDHINTLVDAELYAAGQRVAQGLPSMASHVEPCPRKGRIKMYVRNEEYPHHLFLRRRKAVSTPAAQTSVSP
jgi:hypothetical protein